MHDICPLCGGEDVAATAEDNSVRFECRTCDWDTVETNPFYLGAWSVRIHQALAPLDILHTMMTDPDGVSFLKARIKGVSYLSSSSLTQAGCEASDEYFRGEMDIALQVYLRQMIVLAATYIELILTDFFLCLYRAQPLRMNQVLPPRDKKTAAVPLDAVVAARSKKDLLARLAFQAAKLKAGEQPDKLFKKLTAECCVKLDRPLIEDLTAFRELRNRIVHDDADDQITIDKVQDVFGLVLYVLYVLAQVGEAYKLVCWDDVGFLFDFAEKLDSDSS